MDTSLIRQLFSSFESITRTVDGIECWSARELQTLLGYSKWSNFLTVIDKAKTACQSAGENVRDHFAEVGKMVSIGSGSEREIEDYAGMLIPSSFRQTKHQKYQ